MSHQLFLSKKKYRKQSYRDKIPPSGELIFNKPVCCTIKSMIRSDRCSIHYPLGKPEMDELNQQARINIFKGEGGDMRFEKHAYDSWPV